MPGTVKAAQRLAASRVRSPLRGRGGGTFGLTHPRQWAAFLEGDWAASGTAPAGEAEAMGLPPFGRGVELLANAVAGTDWAAVRWDPDLGVSVKWPTQPGILTRPVPWETPWTYKWAAVTDLILYGNHFALCGPTDWATRRPAYLVPVDATRVGFLEDPEDGHWWFVVDGVAIPHFCPETGDPTVDAPLPDYTGQMFHVCAGCKSGEMIAMGALDQYGAWLGGVAAVEDHAANYFSGGAMPSAVLQSPTQLTQDQAADLKAKWRQMVTSREPVVLPSGYVLTPVVSNARDAQLVEARSWNATEVAMVLGIPTYKLGLPGASMTYQNIESADIEFIRDSVDRYAAPLVAAFSQWLVPNGTTVQLDYAHRMRADQASTAAVLNSYVSTGILTKDEARAVLGRAPLESITQENTTPEGVPELVTQDSVAIVPAAPVDSSAPTAAPTEEAS